MRKLVREAVFLSICALDRDGMEGSSSVESRKDAATSKARQVVGNVGEREGILLCDGVEPSVVDGPTDLFAVLLGNRDKRKRPQ